MITIDLRQWQSLLGRIGATPSSWSHNGDVANRLPEWLIALEDQGIDVNIEEIEVDPGTGHYLFKGQQVLIYIQYTRRPEEVLLTDKHGSPRFHFRDCKTIQEMKAKNRYQRYVAIARTDGTFPVVSQEEDRSVRELHAKLGPCKWCLRETDYKAYGRLSKSQKFLVWDQFSIEEFFEVHSSAITYIPIDSCSAIDPSKYADDWADVSHRARAEAGWRCRLCGVEMLSHRHLLHAHHVDRDKSNNWRYNLRPLCALCHKAQPGHGNMYVSVKDTELIQQLRLEQGISRL